MAPCRIAFVVACCASFAAAARADTLAEIIEITRQREASIQTARITWSETRRTTADALKQITGTLPGSVDVQSPPYDCTLYVSGRKVRYETQLLHQAGSGFTGFRPLITGFDGDVDWGIGGNYDQHGVPEGLIRGKHEYTDIETVTIRPWMLYLRPTHPQILNLDANTFAVETPQTVLNGRPCVVIRERAGVRGPVRYRVWLDRERKFVVVRSAEEFGDRVSSLENIEYREYPEFGWIPSRWDTSWYGADKALYDATVATLTEAQFNQDIDAVLFSPRFPEGTKVRDQRQDGRMFYSLANGELRPYTSADSRKGWSAPLPVWVIAAGVFVALITLLLWRRNHLRTGTYV